MKDDTGTKTGTSRILRGVLLALMVVLVIQALRMDPSMSTSRVPVPSGAMSTPRVPNVVLVVADSLRDKLLECVTAYAELPREAWLGAYCAQHAITTSQIWWTTDVNTAFERLAEGNEGALQDYSASVVSSLNSMSAMVLGELSRGERAKITKQHEARARRGAASGKPQRAASGGPNDKLRQQQHKNASLLEASCFPRFLVSYRRATQCKLHQGLTYKQPVFNLLPLPQLENRRLAKIQRRQQREIEQMLQYEMQMTARRFSAEHF